MGWKLAVESNDYTSHDPLFARWHFRLPTVWMPISWISEEKKKAGGLVMYSVQTPANSKQKPPIVWSFWQFLWNMSFPSLEPHYEMVRDMKQNRSSYHDISLTLVSIGVEKGTSVANIKTFFVRGMDCWIKHGRRLQPINLNLLWKRLCKRWSLFLHTLIESLIMVVPSTQIASLFWPGSDPDSPLSYGFE